MKAFFKWFAIVIGTAAVLFFGSAFVSALYDRQRAEQNKKSAALMKSDLELLQMIRQSIDTKRNTSLACLYVAAISYRLAEARIFDIPRADAIEMSNVKNLVGPIAETGVNPRNVIIGLSVNVYDSPLDPDATFNANAQACRLR